MRVSTIIPRDTKYCAAIRATIAKAGHATNAMIVAALKQDFPGISATTVHRATARLAERGEIGMAPLDPHGAMRYDATIELHDHFMCEQCGLLRDVDIADAVVRLIESKLDGCGISGRLTISGICKKCKKKDES